MNEYPFYRVYDENGQQYCDCGWEKHAQEIIILNKDVQRLSYKKINAPILDQTVDVTATGIAELPGQQGLPSPVERLHDDIRKSLRKPFEPLPQSESLEI